MGRSRKGRLSSRTLARSANHTVIDLVGTAAMVARSDIEEMGHNHHDQVGAMGLAAMIGELSKSQGLGRSATSFGSVVVGASAAVVEALDDPSQSPMAAGRTDPGAAGIGMVESVNQDTWTPYCSRIEAKVLGVFWCGADPAFGSEPRTAP